MAQRLPFNGGQNQPAKKRERGNISFQVRMSFVVVVIDDAQLEHFFLMIYIYIFLAFQDIKVLLPLSVENLIYL